MATAFEFLFASLLLAVALTGCGSSTVRQITILHTNDMHGRHQPVRVEPGNATAQTRDPGRSAQDFGRAGMIGGFAHLAGAVETVRRNKGAENVLLVDGGDTFGDDLLGNITKVERMIAELRAPHRDRLEAVLATANARIGRRYKSESPFDALAGEIMREASGAEIAFLPGLGYGVTIEPGPITREQLYALVPHPSKMVTMTLTGQQVMEILEQSASNQKTSDPMKGIGGLVQTSGLAFTVDLNRPENQRVSNVRVADQSLSPDGHTRLRRTPGCAMAFTIMQPSPVAAT